MDGIDPVNDDYHHYRDMLEEAHDRLERFSVRDSDDFDPQAAGVRRQILNGYGRFRDAGHPYGLIGDVEAIVERNDPAKPWGYFWAVFTDKLRELAAADHEPEWQPDPRFEHLRRDKFKEAT